MQTSRMSSLLTQMHKCASVRKICTKMQHMCICSANFAHEGRVSACMIWLYNRQHQHMLDVVRLWDTDMEEIFRARFVTRETLQG